MKKHHSEELDDMIFELNSEIQRRYRVAQGPIDNRTFLRNAAIGAGVIIGAPLIALAIAYLLGH